MSEKVIGRREFSKRLMGTALSVSLLETIFTGCSSGERLQISETNKIIGSKASKVLNHWSVELEQLCGDLRTSKISAEIWQQQIERLFSRIEIGDLLKFIDFERLTKDFDYPDLGVNTRRVRFPKIDGLPEKTIFLKKIFGMKKGRAIIPHGHSNMSSAHFVLQGELALKHYEKIRVKKDHLIIKPTVEKTVNAGDYSSISDEKDNVHWFVADSEVAFTFDVIMLDLNGKKYDIHNLDIEAGEKISGDLLKVRKIGLKDALRKYGKDHHRGALQTL